jgi:general stress protein YciG
MARIGRLGGLAVSQDRGHMAEIGRKGGETTRRNCPTKGRQAGFAVSEETKAKMRQASQARWARQKEATDGRGV